MSNQQIDAIKAFLQSQGLVRGEDYELGAGESGTDNLSITIELKQDPRALPAELEAYSRMSDYELDRAIYKGCDYRSLSGARFYYALSNYENAEFRKLPEVVAHEETLSAVTTKEELNSYEAELERLWAEFHEANPQIAAWEKDLEENYF